MAELTWQRVLWFLFVMVPVLIKNTSITIVFLNFFRLIIYELGQLLTTRHTLPLTLYLSLSSIVSRATGVQT